MNRIPFADIDITGGFLKAKRDTVVNTTVMSVYNRFVETRRFDALNCRKDDDFVHNLGYDSDIAKWIEGASYILRKERRPDLEKIIDDTVDIIVENSDENGYFNSHYLALRPEEKFTHRPDHELYCAGHLIEAAIAYRDATGKDKFLKAMRKYADYIAKVFMEDKSATFVTPGHPEIELALVKLYDATGEKRYIDLAEFFVRNHGANDKDLADYMNDTVTTLYNQDDMPFVKRSTADGHAVRAMYLAAGAADLAERTRDRELADTCNRIFENVASKRMFVTGGVGSTRAGEAFTVDYHLPNRDGYTETCAAIGLAMFAGRMQRIEARGKYGDVFERAFYNGILSGMSADGKSFFYMNPLEVDPDFNDVNTSTLDKEWHPPTQRKECFDCSCCPPNIVRFIPSFADYMYTFDEDTLYVHQFAESEMNFKGMSVTMTTNYPADGTVKISCNTGDRKLAVRIPGWCRKFDINADYELKNGYAYIDNPSEVVVSFDMPVEVIKANRRVHDCAGRVAITRGPVVYCAEGVDNGPDVKNIRVDINGSFETAPSEFLLPALKTTGYRDPASDELYMTADGKYEEIPLTLIPYFGFANRGETDMNVWLLTK